VTQKMKAKSRALKPRAKMASAARGTTAKESGWPGRKPIPLSAFEKVLVDISTRFIALPSDRVDGEIMRAQQEVCECLDLDHSSLWQEFPDPPGSVTMTHFFARPGFPVMPSAALDARSAFPWTMAHVFKGETLICSRQTDLPPAAVIDLESSRRLGIKSGARFPMSAGGRPVFGAVGFGMFRRERIWSPEIIEKLRIVAQIFANALYRKQIDQALRESEARYRGIFEGSIEGILRISPEGEVLVANPALAKILGYDSAEDFLTSVPDLNEQFWASPEDRSHVLRLLEEKGLAHAYECRARCKDGTLKWLSLNAHRINDPKGRVAYYEGFVQDISERKRMELALAESEKRYRTLFEVTPVGLCVVGTDGKIHMANSRQAQLYGYESPQQLEGFFAPLFITEDDRARAERNFAALTEGKDQGEWIFTAVRRDGSKFPVEVRAVVLRGPAWEPQGYLFLTRDLTKSLQDENERNQLRLERTHLSRVLTVNEISTSLAHEINQPLGAILNNAEAAKIILSQARGTREDIPEILDDIIQDAKRAGDVVRKVRNVLKKGDPRLESLSVNALIDEALDIVHSNLLLSNVTLHLDLKPDLADIRGDRVRLQQVLLNLVTNALESMKEAPAKTLTVRSAMGGPDLVSVSVSDSGPGIPEAGRGMLFEPFFTTKKEGLGLGLSICKSIIEDHGGRIWADNNPGGGAIFSFSLKTWQEKDG
jgi:PAS domain S-box-containing protein